jgi:branched-chain amino acid transport system permease protein
VTAESPPRDRPKLAALPKLTKNLNMVMGSVVVGLVLVVLIGNAIQDWRQFVSVMLTGMTLGAMYCLVALGYTLVYGIIELINFAHGDVFMWGSMAAVTIGVTTFGLDGSQSGITTSALLLVTLACAMALCGTGNVIIERLVYKPLRNAPKLAPLITAIGMSFILQTLALWKYGAREQTADNVLPDSSHHVFTIGIYGYAWKNLLVVLITIPVLVALVYLVRSTRQGKAMRAVAQDTDAARMMGIDVNRTISFTFALAGVLAGAGGTLWVLWQTSTRYDLGFQLGLFAFTAAVLGGIGNLNGAALGAFIIGLLQAGNDGLSWHVPGSSWTQSVVFAVLIMILVFRPQGLLGEAVADRA